MAWVTIARQPAALGKLSAVIETSREGPAILSTLTPRKGLIAEE